MKRILVTLLAALVLTLSLSAQTSSQEDYLRRYNNLVARVGAAGVGVETLVDKWIADYPEDTSARLAQFSFWYTKAQSPKVIQLPQDRYLGREPLLPMKDSLGRVIISKTWISRTSPSVPPWKPWNRPSPWPRSGWISGF